MVAGRKAVAVVARREIRERLRDRATLIGTLVTLAILAAVILVPKALGGDGTADVTVAVQDDEGAALVRAAQPGAEAFDVELELLQVADARREVAEGRADTGVLGGRLLEGDGAPDGAIPALQAASQEERGARLPPPLPVEELGGGDDAKGVAFVAVIVLYGQLIGFGFVLAMGVVEEKGSRIVELLLSAIRPRELLAGKVLGVGVVGLLQLLVIAAFGLALGNATGDVDLGGDGLPAVLAALAWFVLGYALYACLFAAASSLVARQEDVQSVTTPITLVLLAAFFVTFAVVDDPDGTVGQVASYVPFSAPLVMPVRMIAGDVGVGDVLATVAIVLATIAVLVVLAGRIYAAAVLQTGGRVKLARALRG